MIRGKNHWWFRFEMTPDVFELLKLNKWEIKEKDPSKEVHSYMKPTKVQFNFIANVILSNTHYKKVPRSQSQGASKNDWKIENRTYVPLESPKKSDQPSSSLFNLQISKH